MKKFMIPTMSVTPIQPKDIMTTSLPRIEDRIDGQRVIKY